MSKGKVDKRTDGFEPTWAHERLREFLWYSARVRALIRGVLGFLGFELLFSIPRIYFAYLTPLSGLLKPADATRILLSGLALDAAYFGYALLPLIVIFSLFSRSEPRRRSFNRMGFAMALSFACYTLCFSVFSELTFITELGSRFNFIAVDYLIYTTELLHNMWESYPMVPILLGIFAVSQLFFWFLWRVVRIHDILPACHGWRAAFLAAVAVVLHFGIREDKVLSRLSIPAQELAKNGNYAFFAAYRNNEIDFFRFYETLSREETLKVGAQFVRENRERTSSCRYPEKLPAKPNVVFVLMESMSAKYLNFFGGSQEITPNLDRLAHNGLFFDRMFATGTRTVRGIEAVMLALPPTPGQSIVRRPGSEGLYNLGTPFQQAGYETQFVYGGYGVFDNMGPFFESNGFKLVDKSAFRSDEIEFANAWGVSDEDLFRKALREGDRLAAAKKPFFQFILTTSNHRPYTYPEGRVRIPSGEGRNGALQYADYAIGYLVDEARKHSWFKNTVFVFVADHNASVAGGIGVPVRDFPIPFIIYAPDHLTPKMFHNLGSQLDVAPTLLNLLGMSYRSDSFFGESLLCGKPDEVLLGNYQHVGLFNGKKLYLFSPRQKPSAFRLSPHLVEQEPIPVDASDTMALRTMKAVYGYASLLFTEGRLKVDRLAP